MTLAIVVLAAVLGAVKECPSYEVQVRPDWQPLSGTDGRFVVIAPPSFQRMTRGVVYTKGGAAWHDGAATLELWYGPWGPGSLPGHDQGCITVVNGIPVYYIEEDTGMGVHLIASYRIDERKAPLESNPVISAWSSRSGDRDMLRAILLSVLPSVSLKPSTP